MQEQKVTTTPQVNGRMGILRVVVAYCTFASLWIFYSDVLLGRFAQDVASFLFYSTAKGWLFVVISAGLLYGLMRRELQIRWDAQQAMRQSDHRFREAIGHARHFLYRLNVKTQTYDYITQSAAELMGCSMEDLHQRGMAVLKAHVDPEDYKHAWDEIQAAAAAHQTTLLSNYRVYDAKGECRWVTDSTTLLYDPQGQLTALVGAAYDETDRKLLEQDRDGLLQREQAARARAESANRAKDELLAIVSHELRTPLTPILAAADLLRKAPGMPDGAVVLLDRIYQNALSEARLVEDLLDTTRMTAGRLRMEEKPVNIHELLESVVEDFRPDAEAKRITLEADLQAGSPMVRGDQARLRQVFWNLLGNAMKFTPAGGWVKLISRQADGSAAGRIIIQVRDNGIGVEPEVIARLFEPFEQADRSVTRRFGGLGLGLYIARQLVSLHGGTLTGASNSPERGATFTVQIPLAVESPSAPQEPAQPEAMPQGLLVTVVEDNQDTLRLLAAILRRMGCRVLTAQSANEAVTLTAANPTCVLLSDIGLPDRSGWELMRELHMRFGTRGVAVSGFGSDDDRKRSEEAGFAAHLVKPVNVRDLERALRELVGPAQVPQGG